MEKRQEKKDEETPKKKWVLPDIAKQISSLCVGFCFNWFVGSWVANLVKNWLAQYMATGFDTAVYWVVFVGFCVYFGYYGIQKLKPFWNGVPTFLGRPLTWYIIPSGYFWQLPEPFMGFIAVFVKLKDLDIAIKKALSKDNVDIEVDALVQAKVSDPYIWASVEDPDKALKTLVERNIRIYTNLVDSELMPGQKVEFSRHLEKGLRIPVLDKKGNKTPFLDENGNEIIEEDGTTRIKKELVEAVPVASAQWGYGGGIAKCIINDIRIPAEMVKANIDKKVETAQVESETTQQNLFLSLLGGGDIVEGKKAFLKMDPEERSKIIQAERAKRKVITVDGNAGDFTKGAVAGAEIGRG
ncbi:MAG: hypothetical protein ABIG87_01300 [Patescibacteria group bacterium]